MPKRKLTLDKLARMTHQELLSVAKRVDDGFKRVDERFGRVDERFGRVDERFERVEQRLEQGFRAVSDSLDLIRGEIRDQKLARDLISRTIAAEMAELRSRVSRIERKVGLAR